ncbi:helix-turn-helix domain-containing protein [Flavobacterium sp. 3HN19-14]|uniref:helix-turn-helix domain-containing protein n=1 Tax=Flavobacterium sp. 3HN19-14 TaxID=3448133 RepID=UPI003EE1B56F
MEVICLQDQAFYALIEEVVHRIRGDTNEESWKWVNDIDAMRMLNTKSKTTMQKLRDEGKIRFSQPQKKIILYDCDSLNEYLEKHSKNTF